MSDDTTSRARERERQLFAFATGAKPPRAAPPDELLPVLEVNSIAKGTLPALGCCGLPLAAAIAGVAFALGANLHGPWLLAVAGGALILPPLFLASNNVLANTQRFEWRRKYRNFLIDGEVREGRVTKVTNEPEAKGLAPSPRVEIALPGLESPETSPVPRFWKLEGDRVVHPGSASIGAGDTLPVLQDPTDPTLFGVLWGTFEAGPPDGRGRTPERV